MRRLLPTVLLPVLLLAGCAGSPGATAPSSGAPERGVRVVTSTDVWGDIVSQVGGDAVTVEAIITDPDRDPHEYQADPRDRLAVSRAQLVVVNGGHYDDFMTDLTADLPADVPVVDAVAAAGHEGEQAEQAEQAGGTAAAAAEHDDEAEHEHGALNEHVWYDVHGVSHVAEAIEARLSELAPEHADDFAARLKTFQAGVEQLEEQEQEIRATAEGEGVAITEPVAVYLTDALGLVDRTPTAFSEAIEEGDDVAPAVLRQQLDLFTSGDVALLTVNVQTAGATTDQVVAAAKAAGVPVVGVRETLPDGKDWLTWMQDDLDAIRAALAG